MKILDDNGASREGRSLRTLRKSSARRAHDARQFATIKQPDRLEYGDLDGLLAATQRDARTDKARALIITADDFGLHVAINEAVERASREGVLSAASLMVAAPAAADAVRRARTLPGLSIGLHLVLADGPAMLDPAAIPMIADAVGHMDDRMFQRAVRMFCSPRARRQIAAEIRAQFIAYARTGLTLDHVNVHKHFHLHPTLMALLLDIGRDFGMRSMRLPGEPLWYAITNHWHSVPETVLLKPWLMLMRRRLKSAGIFHNDIAYGVAASGAMDEAELLRIIRRLPAGVSEIYLHPAMPLHEPITPTMRGYRHVAEFAALTSPRVRAAIETAGVPVGGFGDAWLANHAAGTAG